MSRRGAAAGGCDNKFYKLLEVEPTADVNEIKKAYRKLAMKWYRAAHRSIQRERPQQTASLDARMSI